MSGGGYLDFNVAARWVGRFAVLDLEAGARPSSTSSSSAIPAGIGTYAEAAALVRINERVAATFSGGEYPTDPIRGLLGARYLAIGLRVHLVTPERSSPVARVVSDAFGRSAELLNRSTDASEAQLEQISSGSLTTLRLTVPGATRVEVMGDFTDWAATPLREVRPAVWILTMPIEPGTHRLNVRVNGGEWRVPRGTRLEEGEFGGAVGVIVIP